MLQLPARREAKLEKPAEMSAFFISPLSKPLILLIIAETRRAEGWFDMRGFQRPGNELKI
jgi:hypothetical protein